MKNWNRWLICQKCYADFCKVLRGHGISEEKNLREEYDFGVWFMSKLVNNS